MNTEFYPMQQTFAQYNNNFAFNYDMLNVEREVKVDETYNLLPALWNFEDYFTI